MTRPNSAWLQRSNAHSASNFVEGTVEAANERLQGDWYNQSQFRPARLPEVGQAVRLEVDSKGFIRGVEVLDGDETTLPQVGAKSRERTISRLAGLKAAAE